MRLILNVYYQPGVILNTVLVFLSRKYSLKFLRIKESSTLGGVTTTCLRFITSVEFGKSIERSKHIASRDSQP